MGGSLDHWGWASPQKLDLESGLGSSCCLCFLAHHETLPPHAPRHFAWAFCQSLPHPPGTLIFQNRELTKPLSPPWSLTLRLNSADGPFAFFLGIEVPLTFLGCLHSSH